MRFAFNSLAISLPVFSRTALTVATALFLGLPCAMNVAFPDESTPRNWLKCNEDGEPYEVTLADGTALKLETYGDEYDAYEYRPPLTGDKAEFVFGADRGPNIGWGDLALDLVHQKAYWVEGSSKVTQIMCGQLNGAGARPLMALIDLSPVNPTPDPKAGKLYWYTRGLANGSGRAIYRANLDGSNAKPVVTGLMDFSGFTVDSVDHRIYYFEGRRLIRTEADGADESAILESSGGPLAIDHDGGKIYWSNRANVIRRANLDGSQIEDIIDAGSGHIPTIALDCDNQKIYWHNSNYHHVCRANLDGTQPETIVVGMLGATNRLAIDIARRNLYWMATNHKERGRRVGLWRVATKKPLVAKTLPAPPFVTRTAPEKCVAGDEITVYGGHFTGVTKVLLIDDGTSENVKAGFTGKSDKELSVVIPRMSKRSRHPMIVIESSGGVTVTFPRNATVIHTGSSGGCDRFHDDDKFAYFAEPGSNIGGERAALFVSQRSLTGGGSGQGRNTIFLKSGAIAWLSAQPNNLIFCEPFSVLIESDSVANGTRLVHVPAIRPSFLEALLEVEEKSQRSGDEIRN